MKAETIRRFAFIETRLLYGGGITARELGEMFGLSRQAAQAVITRYAALHPENIKRDLSRRRQVARDGFRPKYVRKNVRFFLDHLRGQALSGYFFQDVEWSEEIVVEDVTAGIRPKINIDATHEILLGLFNKHPVYAEYRSKKKFSSRILSPHAVIFAHNRYLVRCYCHLKMAYLDFSFSRFRYAELADREEWVSGMEDKEWNEYIELHYVPNPKLPLSVQNVIREDYLLEGKEVLTVRCRKVAAYYIKKDMENEKIMDMNKWVIVDKN